MNKPKISRTAARAVLAELQGLANDRAGLLKENSSLDDGTFARIVIASLIGSLEARLPRAEWNQVDVYQSLRCRRRAS
jgi:hypothetical protein